MTDHNGLQRASSLPSGGTHSLQAAQATRLSETPAGATSLFCPCLCLLQIPPCPLLSWGQSTVNDRNPPLNCASRELKIPPLPRRPFPLFPLNTFFCRPVTLGPWYNVFPLFWDLTSKWLLTLSGMWSWHLEDGLSRPTDFKVVGVVWEKGL